jgi:hypothetical protein
VDFEAKSDKGAQDWRRTRGRGRKDRAEVHREKAPAVNVVRSILHSYKPTFLVEGRDCDTVVILNNLSITE